MKITDLLSVKAINLQEAAGSKEEVLRHAVDLMVAQGNVSNRDLFLQAVLKREEEGSTGVGGGIGIPHGRCEGVKRPGLAAMVIPDGVEYDALDGAPVHLMFLIAVGPDSGNTHIEILSKLSGMLMHPEFTDALQRAKTPEEFLGIINAAEEEKQKADDLTKAQEQETSASSTKEEPLVLAVTGCPTGIAHTFMAAEALEKAAKEKNIRFKVETRGANGVQNLLTDEEIQSAVGIIVAADTKVPMDRFHGKPVLEVPVSDGISKANELLDKALGKKFAIYERSEEEEVEASVEGAGIIHKIYKHLMNGVSHMLPFVVGGGILIAIAFLIDSLSLSAEELKQVGSAFGTVNPTAALFNSIGSAAFKFMLPILSGYIAMSLVDRPGLVVGMAGGYIASQGQSGFLGAIAAGFLAGYIMKAIMRVCKNMPKALNGIKPVLIYPVVGVLGVGIFMELIIEPFVGVINAGMNSGLAAMSDASGILLGFVLAGMMAIDMGGPFNKAAYLFGTAAIAAGNYNIMAAVMIGGMVPPCAIALSTLLFKSKYTIAERKSGPTNFIMGLAFITEGAIPFAAADPFRVIPACIIGSGIAGAMSMAAGCTLMAPHGGVFVFPVVGHPIVYLTCLTVGTLVTAVILGLIKKEVKNK